MKFIKSLYLNNFFFYVLIGIIGLFVCAFIFPNMYNAVWSLVLGLVTFLVLDILLLYFARTGLEAERITPEKLSNGDLNPIKLHLKNHYTFPISVKIIDEIPFQFQVRDFKIVKTVKASFTKRNWLRSSSNRTRRIPFWISKHLCFFSVTTYFEKIFF